MATNVGSVSVRVVPDASQFVNDLRRGLDSPADRLGKEIGKKLGNEVGQNINKSVADALANVGDGELGKSGSKMGKSLGDSISKGVGDGFKTGVKNAQKGLDSELGDFAREVNKKVTSALSSLPSKRTVSFDVDSTGLDKALTMLRALQSKRVGIDLQSGAAIADLDKILIKLREVERSTARAEVKVDVQNAIREIDSLRSYVNRAGEQAGKDYGGAFEREVKGALSKAAQNINIRPEFDGSNVDTGLANIQRRIETLRNARVGVDMDASEFEMEYGRIRAELARLSSDSAEVHVRADAAAALASMYAVNEYLEKLDGKTARANVNVDDGGTAYAVDTSISRLLNKLMLFGAAGAGIAGIVGPLLALAAAGAVAGAAIGAAAISFGGIGDAVKALSDQQAKAGTEAKKLGAAQGQQAAQIESAQARVAQATRNVGNVQASVAAQATRAAASVRDAEQKVTQAREKAGQDEAKAAAGIVTAQARVQEARETAADNAVKSSARIADAQRTLQRAERSLADDAVSSNQAIARARQGVADATEQSTRNIASAISRTQSAERTLAAAQRDGKKAQEDLTRARVDAQRGLLDMRDQLANNVLSQRRNTLDLVEAQQELNKTLADPTATNLQRERAKLAYDEALQQGKELRREGQELGTDYAATAQKGVEGSDQVVSAQEKVTDSIQAIGDAQRDVGQANADLDRARRDGAKDVQRAQESLADAERTAANQRRDDLEAISDAQRGVSDAQAAASKQARDDAKSIASAQDQVRQAEAARAQTQADSARSIRDAEESLASARSAQQEQARQGASQLLEANDNVKDAQRALQQAYQQTGSTAETSADKVAQAFANLSAPAAAFARYLFSLKPLWQELQGASAGAFLPALQRGMENFLRNFASFKSNVAGLAAGTGVFVEDFLNRLSSPAWLDFWAKMADASRGVALRASSSFDQIGQAVGRFITALTPINSIGFDALDSLSGYLDKLAPAAPLIAVPLSLAFMQMLRSLEPLIPALAALAPVLAALGRILASGIGGVLIALVPLFNALGVILGFVADALEAMPGPLRAVLFGLIALQLARVVFSDMRLASRFAKDSLTDLSKTSGSLQNAFGATAAESGKASAALIRNGGSASAASKAILSYGGATGAARRSNIELGSESDRLNGKLRAQGRQHLSLRASVLFAAEASRFARTAWSDMQDAYVRGSTRGAASAEDAEKRITDRTQKIAESSKRAGDAIAGIPGRIASASSAIASAGRGGFDAIGQQVIRTSLALQDFGDKVGSQVSKGLDRVTGALAPATNAVRDFGIRTQLAAGLIGEGLGNSINTMRARLSLLKDSFRDATSSPEAFRQAITRMANDVEYATASGIARLGEFKERVTDSVGVAANRIGLAAQDISTRMGEMANRVGTAASDTVRSIGTGITGAAASARAAYTNLSDNIQRAAIQGSLAWQDHANKVSTYLKNLTLDVGTYRDANGRMHTENGRFMKESAQSGETYRNVVRNLATDAQVLYNRASLAAGDAAQKAVDAGARLRTAFAGGWDAIRTQATTTLANVGESARQIPTTVATAATTAAGSVRTSLAGIRDSFVSGFTSMRTVAGEAVTNVGNTLRNIPTVARGALTGIGETFTRAFAGVGSAVTTGLAGARTAIAGIGDVARGAAAAGVTGLRSAVGGLVGALGGPWGLAITGATIALGIFASKQQEAAQAAAAHRTAIDNLKGSLDQYTGAVTEATLQQKANQLSTDKLGDSNETAAQIAQRFGINLGDVTRAMLGQQDALGRVNGQLGAQAQRVIEGSGVWRNYQTEIASTGLNMDILKQAALGNQDAIGKVENAISLAGGASTDFGGALTLMLGQLKNNSGGLQQLGAAIGGSNADLRAAQVETLTTRAAFDGMRVALDGSRGSFIALGTTAFDMNGVLTRTGPIADQLRGSLASIGGAAHDSALAAGELARRNGDVGGAALGASLNLGRSRQALIDTAMQAGLTAGQANGLANSMGLIPQLVTTQFNTVGEAQVQEAMGIVRDRIVAIPNDKTVTVRDISAEAQQRLRDLGFIVTTLPDGTINVTSNTAPASEGLRLLQDAINRTHGNVVIDGDAAPGVQALQGFKLQTDATTGLMSIDGNINPADAARLGIQAKTDGTRGTMTINGNPVECDGKLNGMRVKIDATTGIMSIDGDPRNADGQAQGIRDRIQDPNAQPVMRPQVDGRDAESWFSRFIGSVSSEWNRWLANPLSFTPGANAAPPPPAPRAMGGIDKIRGMARGGVRGMAAGVATTVAPNTPTLIGDRKKDDEAYIPINRDPRSIAILKETAARMGFELTPTTPATTPITGAAGSTAGPAMARGGILAMAAGGVVGGAAAAPAATAPAATTAGGLPFTAAEVTALNAAVLILNASLAAMQLQVTSLNLEATALSLTTNALVLTVNTMVIPALLAEATIISTLLVPALIAEATTLSTMLTPAQLAEATALNALLIPAQVAEATTLNALLIPALVAEANTINALLLPAVVAEANTINAVLVPALVAEANTINALLVPALLAEANTINAAVVPAMLLQANTTNTILIPALVAETNTINALLIPALLSLAAQINSIVVPAELNLTNTTNALVVPALVGFMNQINNGNIPSLINFGANTNTLVNTALIPLVNTLNTSVFPTMQRYQFEVGTANITANTGFMASLTQLRGAMDLTAQNVQTNTGIIRQQIDLTNTQGGAALLGLQQAMQVTQNVAKLFADGMTFDFNRLRGAVADPIRWTMQFPLGPPGLAASWNTLDDQFKLGKRINPPVPNFRDGGTIPNYATGGKIPGTGSGTEDNVPIMASAGEFVVREKVASQHKSFLNALNSGQTEARQAAGGSRATMKGYAAGGVIEAVARAQQFAQQQAGKPYVWAASGPGGYDCSGYMSAITNVLRGDANPYHRIGATGSFPWGGFTPGLTTAFTIGSTPDAGGGVGHMAGTLGGGNVESRGGQGVINGPGARGSDNSLFNMKGSLGVVGGQFVSGGAGGGGGAAFDPTPIINEKFQKTYDMVKDITKFFGDSPHVLGVQNVAQQATDAVKGKATEQLASMFAATGGSGLMGGLGAGAQFYVAEISRAAKTMGMGKDAAIIGTAVALVESDLRMMASPADPASMGFPHDVVSVDHDSTGLFQQRNSAEWGTIAQRMNAFGSAIMFFEHLKRMAPNYAANPGEAAADVQRPAAQYRGRYAQRMPQATGLVNMWGGFDQGGIATDPGLMAKWTAKPERVLSPQQTQAFDSLVNTLTTGDSVFSGAFDSLEGLEISGRLEFDADGHQRIVDGRIEAARVATASRVRSGRRW